MKKIYTYFFLLSIFCATNASATLWQVSVLNSSFSPNTLPNVVCGDTVAWVLSSVLSHTTTSTTIPAGATSWNAPINSSTPAFAYIVPNFAGVYNYVCTPHGFTGSFTVTCSVGIDQAQQKIASLVYPNPFSSKLTITNHGADAFRITDVTGQVVAAKTLSADEAEINLDGLEPGVYFLTTWKEGILRQTEKIIKQK